MKEGRCKARVWDNGDMANCGRGTTHKSGVCYQCRRFKTPYLKAAIRKQKKALTLLVRELRSYR